MRSHCAIALLLVCLSTHAVAEADEFQSEEISFRSVGGIVLSGSLTLPRAVGPHPAIVMIGGSERMDRKSMYHWADAESYVSQGIAVFCFDSPGTGKSEGKRFERTHKERTEDTVAAIKAVSAREDIDSDSVGVYGASEGGVVVFRVASRFKKLAFAVAIAAPTVPDYQDINNTVESLAVGYGLKGIEVEKLVVFNHLVSDLVRNHSTIDFPELKRKVTGWDEPGWSELLSLVQNKTDSNREAAKNSFIEVTQKWNGESWFRGTEMLLGFWKQVAKRLEIDLDSLGIDFGDGNTARNYVELFYVVGQSKISPDPSRDEDPASFLKRVECPMLCVYGERDPLARGVGIIQKVLTDTKHDDFFIKVVTGAGHQLEVANGERTERHEEIDSFIRTWVQQKLRQNRHGNAQLPGK